MLLTNKIYEGNLFMRYSKHLTYAEEPRGNPKYFG